MTAAGIDTSPVRRLRDSADLRRLFACVGGALVLAVMTGPSGSITSPLSGITGSLGNTRVLAYIAIGVGLFALTTVR
jgi:branched-chain amino acid transport system permease protein